MLLRDDVNLVEVGMCDFGMMSSDAEGEGLVRKTTKILTNSDEVAKRMARKCSKDHRHVNIIGGRAKRAQLYPPVLQPETVTCFGNAFESHREV